MVGNEYVVDGHLTSGACLNSRNGRICEKGGTEKVRQRDKKPQLRLFLRFGFLRIVVETLKGCMHELQRWIVRVATMGNVVMRLIQRWHSVGLRLADPFFE